jgi:hypothetical protein
MDLAAALAQISKAAPGDWLGCHRDICFRWKSRSGKCVVCSFKGGLDFNKRYSDCRNENKMLIDLNMKLIARLAAARAFARVRDGGR